MVLNIILAVSFVPIWSVMYFIILNYAKPKKNLILETTVPYASHNDPDVLAVCAAFRKRMKIFMLPALPLLLPPFFMDSQGAALTWFMVWLIYIIAAPFVVFAAHREKMQALKREKGWSGGLTGKTAADIKAAGIPVFRINGLWFLPPVIASVIPVFSAVYSGEDFAFIIVYASFAVTAVLFWLIYRIIYRLRSEVVNDDITLTMALTRVRRYNWGKFWITGAWLTGAFNVCFWALGTSETGILIAVSVYTAVILAAALKTEFTARAAQQKLTAGNIGETYIDEDDYWLWGIFYHNPNDSHFFVNDRVGMSMSVNLARLGGKITMVLTGLLLVSMPFIGIWLMVEERTPPALVLSDTELTARHTRDQYVIPLGDIENAELINELPPLRRTAGTGLPNLLKGRFRTGDTGALVCLQPQIPPFIVIQAGGATYILNDADAEVTRAVYERLDR